jgi:hypothetical protein
MTPFSDASASRRAQELVRDQAVQSAPVCASPTGEIQIRILRWMPLGDWAVLEYLEQSVDAATPEAHATAPKEVPNGVQKNIR